MLIPARLHCSVAAEWLARILAHEPRCCCRRRANQRFLYAHGFRRCNVHDELQVLDRHCSCAASLLRLRTATYFS